MVLLHGHDWVPQPMLQNDHLHLLREILREGKFGPWCHCIFYRLMAKNEPTIMTITKASTIRKIKSSQSKRFRPWGFWGLS